MPEPIDHRLLSSHQYALVATECIDRVPQHIARLPTATGMLADSAALLPVLVHLASLAPTTLGELQQSLEDDLQEGRAPQFCTLLESDAAPKTLATHLGSVQVIANKARERAWLRVHDPRAWLQLTRILNPQQLRRLCGPIVRWTTFLHGHWMTHANDQVAVARPLTLDENAWAAVGRIGAVNRVLARLRITTHSEIERFSPAIDALIMRSQRLHALRRMEDLVEYASLGLTVHPCFDEHEDVVRAVRDAKAEAIQAEFNFIDALSAIDRQTWQRVQRELNETGAARQT